MNVEDLLIIYIEVSIAIAGFSGIISALKKQDGSSWQKEDAVSFQFLLTASGFCAVLSAIPMVMTLAGLENIAIWRWSSLCILAVAVFAGGYRTYQFRTTPNFRAALTRVVFMTALILSNVYLAVSWLYVTILTLLLAIIFITFTQLVVKFSSVNEEDV